LVFIDVLLLKSVWQMTGKSGKHRNYAQIHKSSHYLLTQLQLSF